jgi:glycosyltransferase involved in cell wall biosynthesis
MQSFTDFEVVVVDDASTDDTVAVLERMTDPRLHIVKHNANRGINPARFTGVANSRGEWLVVLDSDWELLPQSLQRLSELIHDLSADVRVLRSRLRWDDGRVTPTFVPGGAVEYEERIRFVEAEGGSDAGRCLHRSVFGRTPYFADRRGGLEILYELNLSRNETFWYVSDVLGLQHTDAPNSTLRGADRRELIPRLLQNAPDALWFAETTLRDHGRALEQWGPRQYRTMLRTAALQAFLLGRRRTGLRYARRCARRRLLDPLLWSTVALGLVGPRALAYGNLAFRKLPRGGT